METASDLAPAAFASLGPGADSELSASQAALLLEVDRHVLVRAYRDGLVRGRTVERGRRAFYLFLRSELLADAAALSCGVAGCDRPGLGVNGSCMVHSHRLRGPKISESKRGPAEERRCEYCGWSLGLVPLWATGRGRARFCSISHAKLWLYENEPWPFGRGDRSRIVECWICNEQIRRYASQVEAAETEQRRFVCPECDLVWRPRLMEARRAVDRMNPRGPLPTLLEIKRLTAVARRFDDEIRSIRPLGRGHPRQLANDMIIEALHERGFKDRQIDAILGAAARYSETRRRRAGIRRRGPGDRWPNRRTPDEGAEAVAEVPAAAN